MSIPLNRSAFTLAAFLVAGITTSLPLSVAASAQTSPNMIGNAVIDRGMNHVPSTGFYDEPDQYRDAKGFPQPGWQYLFFPPN